jgi:hypothetical protein
MFLNGEFIFNITDNVTCQLCCHRGVKGQILTAWRNLAYNMSKMNVFEWRVHF